MATLKVLNELSYILECAALDYLGEGKSALSGLCQHLESDSPEYAIENRKHIARELQTALDAYRSGDKMTGTSLLAQVNRSLWESQVGAA